MRAYEILTEYNRDITAKRYGEKLLARNEERDVDLILSYLEQGDPTPNKQYTQWIVLKYIQGDFLLEDIYVVKKYIEKFIEARRMRLLDINDINRFKTLGDLKNTIKKLYSTNDTEDSESDSVYPILPDTKIYYNGPEGQFVTPLTLKSSMDLQKIGNEAEWCTADSRAPTYYPRYTAHGPLYIWIDNSGEKFQFHFNTDGDPQFMDENDVPIRVPEYYFNVHNVTSPILGPIARQYFHDKILLDPFYFPYVPYSYRTSEMTAFAVKSVGNNLKYAPKPYISFNLCLDAVKQNGFALKFVPDDLMTYEICLSAVKQNGLALKLIRYEGEFTKEEMTSLSLNAISQDTESIVYIPDYLKNDEFYFKALDTNIDTKYFINHSIVDRYDRQR